MTLDEYKEGMFDENSPINQKEVDAEPVHTWNNLTEAYDSGHEHIFKEMQTELLQDCNLLRYAMESVDSGLIGLLNKIIEKLE